MSRGQGWVPSPVVVPPAPAVPAPLPEHPAGLTRGGCPLPARSLPAWPAPKGHILPALHCLPGCQRQARAPSLPCQLGTASGHNAASAPGPAAWRGASIYGDSTLPGWGDGDLGWAQGWERLPGVHCRALGAAPQPPVPPLCQGCPLCRQGSPVPCPLPAPCPRLAAPMLFVTPVTMARERLAIDPPLPPQATDSYS